MQADPWHVIHVRSNYEKRIVQHLTVHAVENYLPTYHERRKWSDRVVVAERALFPGYVFAHVHPKDRVTVLSIPGVVRILGDKSHGMVSADELDRIHLGLESGLTLRPHRSLGIGTSVRVCRGVFEGAKGIVEELRKQCRVILSLSGTQQCFSLEIALDDIEPWKESERPNTVMRDKRYSA